MRMNISARVVLLILQKNSYHTTTHVKIIESDHTMSMEGLLCLYIF